jgi:hypothetical protein
MTEMTAGQIRQLTRRVYREKDRMDKERSNLTVGLRAVQERLDRLREDQAILVKQGEDLNECLKVALMLPRGRKVTVASGPEPFATYNPHRRLAVMERSYL